MQTLTMDFHDIEQMAQNMRRNILDISYSCNASAHIGGALSMIEITATLYGRILRFDVDRPNWVDRDRFILSKGHGALGYYSALLEVGIISKRVFDSFQVNGSDLTAHPVMNMELGIESSNGSLGQGLSLAVGIALAAKKLGKKHKTYVLVGNGECNEGAIWEAAMSAAQFQLDNLVAIIDNNGYQNDGDSREIMESHGIGIKWASFGWNLHSVDGHNIGELHSALMDGHVKNKPTVIVANTTKGKGVSFMENNNDWHHNRLTEDVYNQAVTEMEQN